MHILRRTRSTKICSIMLFCMLLLLAGCISNSNNPNSFIPTYPNSQNMSVKNVKLDGRPSMGEVYETISFDTPDKQEEVINFYSSWLKNDGWSVSVWPTTSNEIQYAKSSGDADNTSSISTFTLIT